ncbi:hypothetical protein EST38_g8106 [Candolleomyces aberdarensis]|uniref:Nephrocystin 3-like N-terminal domain-containing protein n=1 Tax=Candolleomyces aberdarensis TaxID=2316362 RepID=A0A4Q2DG95_9AGAR|nr:hypothetical protein EST38_g8106 [Candolleomyces aberdarensis]
MLRTKRQLSQGSVDAVGPSLQRRRSSFTQASIGRQGEREDRNDDTDDRRTQGYSSVHLPAVYNQQFSHAPIINGNIYGGVQNNIQSSTLDSLQFLYQHAAMGAVHESEERYPPPLCYPGTRDVVVRRVIGWYLDKDGRKKIMWVHAPLGYGKTAVAGTVKEKLDAVQLGFDSPVGATFFFWRSSPERNSPARFIITLAYQLARSIPELRPIIDAAIKSQPDVVKMALEIQLLKLIVEPFKSFENLATMPNRLVIVDGIDECINSDRESLVKKKYAEDQEVVQIRVLDLIHRLQSHHLPLSFLILSRPEAWIKRHLESRPLRDVVEPVDLYKVGDHMSDVKRFVRAELSRIAESFGLEGADEEWPEEEALVRKSEGHMVYAATVIRHIDDEYSDPRQLLKDIIENAPAHRPDIPHSTPFSYLYELYRQIMRSCPERNRSLMMEVLGEVMITNSIHLHFENYAHNAALGVLDRLSRRPPHCGVKALRPLHAVLWVGRGYEDSPIFELFIHSSFREFLESSHLSFEFAADTSKAKARLLSTMLDRMTSITTDTIGSKLEDNGVLLALESWCSLWGLGKKTLLKSKTTYSDLMNKVIALDLTACIIQTYCSLRPEAFSDYSPVEKLFDPSKFFIESMESDGCADTLSIAHKVTSHAQSSLDSAITFMLQATTPLALSKDAVGILAWDCARYLHDVATEPDWREHKVVRALVIPGPNGIDLCKEIIYQLYEMLDHWTRPAKYNLLKHIYKAMVREKNPILDSEDNPFLEDDDIDEPESESDYESDS